MLVVNKTSVMQEKDLRQYSLTLADHPRNCEALYRIWRSRTAGPNPRVRGNSTHPPQDILQYTPLLIGDWTSACLQHPANTLLQRVQRVPMLANCQNDKPVPNRVASPSELVDPRPDRVVGRAPGMGNEQTFREVSSIEKETDEVGYERRKYGG